MKRTDALLCACAGDALPAARPGDAFAAWLSFAHVVAMGTLGFEMPEMKVGFVAASVVLVVIGAVLLARLPKRATPA